MLRKSSLISILVVILLLSGCSSPRFATRPGSGSSTPGRHATVEEGYASYYAEEFHGRKTSNGETYDMNSLTAAHPTLPFNTKVRVNNTQNGKSVVVRINDRGPFKDNRIMDLSLSAAKTIGLIGPGTAWVKLEILEIGSESR
jgi:rare lipoprotein A